MGALFWDTPAPSTLNRARTIASFAPHRPFPCRNVIPSVDSGLGITSNLVFSEWERIFANPMATAAAIDRVVHHSVILEFDVPSYRTNAAQQRGQAKEVNRQN